MTSAEERPERGTQVEWVVDTTQFARRVHRELRDTDVDGLDT